MNVKSLVFLLLFIFCTCLNTGVQLVVYQGIIAMSANKLFHRLENIYLGEILVEWFVGARKVLILITQSH